MLRYFKKRLEIDLYSINYTDSIGIDQICSRLMSFYNYFQGCIAIWGPLANFRAENGNPVFSKELEGRILSWVLNGA